MVGVDKGNPEREERRGTDDDTRGEPTETPRDTHHQSSLSHASAERDAPPGRESELSATHGETLVQQSVVVRPPTEAHAHKERMPRRTGLERGIDDPPFLSRRGERGTPTPRTKGAMKEDGAHGCGWKDR